MPRTKAVPLTSEQLQLLKDVKRINERIADIAREYGTESRTYNKYYSAVKSSIPERFRRTQETHDASGAVIPTISISRSKEFLRTASSWKTQSSISRLLGMKTKGKLYKEARKDLKEAGNKKPTKEEVQERAKLIDRVIEYVEDHSSMFYIPPEQSARASEIAHTTGRKKTYEELDELVNIYKKQVNAGNVPVKDVFEGLE